MKYDESAKGEVWNPWNPWNPLESIGILGIRMAGMVAKWQGFHSNPTWTSRLRSEIPGPQVTPRNEKS